jgi:cytochrome c oxidase assembly protein subunit 15
VAASTALLILAGGLVTSTGSGLSVPDWPTTYGWFMLTFPLDKWVGGIFYEHSHRVIASVVGFLIVILAIWLWNAEPRRWVRQLGYIALGAVMTQGVLGGITVLWFLPDAISIAHAGLAQLASASPCRLRCSRRRDGGAGEAEAGIRPTAFRTTGR